MSKAKQLLNLVNEDHDKMLCTSCGKISPMESWEKEGKCPKCGDPDHGTTDLDAEVDDGDHDDKK